MDTTLFLIPDLAHFKTKVRDFFPADYLQTIVDNAGRAGTEGSITSPLNPPFNWHAALAWLITGEERYALTARQSILHFTAQLRVRELYREGQIDHWVGALPVSRVLVYYTWVRNSGVFSDADSRYVEQSFADYLYLNVYQSTRLKSVHDGNNQTAALVISCIIMGYILGHLIDARASAQMILLYGFERLGPLLGSMPATGYTGEGSTYMAVVAAPSFALLDASIEYIAGHRIIDQRFYPDRACIRDLLEMNYRCATPSGYLLPWDHYDYVPTLGSASLAWLSRNARPEILGMIRDFGVFHYNHEIMWGGDDQVLAAVFWPEAHERRHTFGSWIHPDVGGALYGGSETGLYAFQMWDRCAGTNPVRQQANPNSLLFEFGGVPFLMDGMPAEDCARFSSPDTEFRNQDGLAYNFGYGTLAGHNVVIVDGDEFYRPRESAVGKGVAGVIQERFSAVRADVTAFYRDLPDARRVERTTIMISPYSVVIVDDLSFEQEHRFESRFFLRGDALSTVVTDGARCYETAIDGMRAYLFPDHNCDTESERIAGYPRVFECVSTRVGVTSYGTRCRLVHVLSAARTDTGTTPDVMRTTDSLSVRDHAGLHSLDLLQVPSAGEPLKAGQTVETVGQGHLHAESYAESVAAPAIRSPRAAFGFESAHDRCFTAAIGNKPDVEVMLHEMLQSQAWEDRLAAVDCAAHYRLGSCADRLYDMLVEEAHNSYADIYERYVWLREARPGQVERRCEWRLKTALCRAMGDLNIDGSRGLLERISESPDHSAVHKACRESLEKLGHGK